MNPFYGFAIAPVAALATSIAPVDGVAVNVCLS
jgi:hypothetical protein